MSFREKFAWLMAALMIALGTSYVVVVCQMSQALGETAPPALLFLAIWLMLVVTSSVLVYGVAGLVSRKEWQVPVDERERLVHQRAGNWSGIVLAVAILGALGHFIVRHNGNMLFHLVMGSLVASQFAKYAFQIFFIRRGI